MDRSNAMVRVDERKLREMARGIDELIAHYHEYDELDEAWLAETARRLRKMAASATPVAAAVDRVRAYLDAHASSHRHPAVIANLVPNKPDGRVIELRVDDLRELLTDPGHGAGPYEGDAALDDLLRRPGAFGGPPL